MGKWGGSRSAETRTQGGKMYQWCKVRQCRRARALPVLAVWKKKKYPPYFVLEIKQAFFHTELSHANVKNFLEMALDI